MEIDRIAIRCVLTFVFLLALVRLAGKRTVSEGKPFDFVMALVLGDLSGAPLFAEVPASQFVVAAGTLVAVHLATAFAAFRLAAVDRLVEGSPVAFLRDGALVDRGRRREVLAEVEVERMLREEGIDRSRWPEVRSARIEKTGEASVLLHEWAEPAQKRDRHRLPRGDARG